MTSRHRCCSSSVRSIFWPSI